MFAPLELIDLAKLGRPLWCLMNAWEQKHMPLSEGPAVHLDQSSLGARFDQMRLVWLLWVAINCHLTDRR